MHCNFSPSVPKPVSKSYYACISQTDISGAATDTVFHFFQRKYVPVLTITGLHFFKRMGGSIQ